MESANPVAATQVNCRWGGELKRVVVEACIVAVAGGALGLFANFLSPRGLALTRNYFPALGGVDGGPVTPGSHVAARSNPSLAAVATGTESVTERLRAKGLQPISDAEAVQLYLDPQREQGMIVFVDARDDPHYQAGHIPGAYQLDRYYPEKYLLGVLPACLRATKVVVYCTGGACEDSEYAALALVEAGVPHDHVHVFAEGMASWSAQGRPIEVGARNSGQSTTAQP